MNINKLEHGEKRSLKEKIQGTIQNTNGKIKEFFKSSEKKEYEGNEKQFMEIFEKLSLKQQLLLSQLLGDYIDDEGYPHSAFLSNFEFALKDGKDLWEKEQAMLNLVKEGKIIKYKRSNESLWVWQKMNKSIEESKKQYSEESIQKIISEVHKITALQPSEASEAILKSML